jgi:hypothetical protein
MICLTDTRLDNFIGLQVVARTTHELNKHTGKTWHGRPINRRENGKSGGAMILYTSDWTGVKIVEKVMYGVCTEIQGKWKGEKYTVMAVYRPCNNESDGSLRVSVDYEMRGKLEEVLWGMIKENESGVKTKMIGGDFNMNGAQVDKELMKNGNGTRRIELQERIHETTIDHVLVLGRGKYGSRISNSGMDANDHAIII